MKKTTVVCMMLVFCLVGQAQSTLTSVSETKETKVTVKKKASKGAEAIIRHNIAAFSKALMEQNYDAVVAAYTNDGKIFPGGRDILRGEAAIREYWTPKAGSTYRTSYHHITPEEIVIKGDTAYDYGYYEGKSINNEGKESSWKGKYVIVWKRVGKKEWKIYLDIWNRI
ncbi:MAG: hypothetical protein DHS20C18_31960 [Saprospiraceae bacterium]|nr:MAG: hypothetical protein DHS20C18_31960 [Saprospiraceae bacterium]